jgi:ABC-type transport system involved in cytochrome c biogenesis permease subunit
MTATVIVYLLVWVPLVFAGRALGRRRGNPEAGFWLPALLGALGFAMFIVVAVIDGPVPRRS